MLKFSLKNKIERIKEAVKAARKSFDVKKILPYVLVILVAVVILSTPTEAHAAGPLSWIGGLIGKAKDWLVDQTMKAALATVAMLTQLISWMASLVLTIAALLFDLSMKFTFSHDIGNMAAVTAGWMVIRDVCNITFIFLLLYISISTILQLSGYHMKRLLVTVILVALLINFSMLAAKVIIDASNIIALTFYEAIGGTSGGAGSSISAKFAAGIQIQQTQALTAETDLMALKSTIALNIGATILYAVTAYTFWQGASIFIVRYVVFVFLLIFAPLAFLGWAWPKLGRVTTKWWDALFSQALVAPAYLFLIYVVISIIDSNFLNTTIKSATQSDDLMGYVELIFNYIILTGLMWGSVKVAKEVGGEFTNMALGFADKAKGWATAAATGGAAAYVWRQTGGRAMARVSQSETMKAMTARAPTLGGMALKGLKAGAEAGTGKVAEKHIAAMENMSDADTARYLSGLSDRDRNLALAKMDASRRGRVISAVEGDDTLKLSRVGLNLKKSLRTLPGVEGGKAALAADSAYRVKNFNELSSAQQTMAMRDMSPDDMAKLLALSEDADKTTVEDRGKFKQAYDRYLSTATGDRRKGINEKVATEKLKGTDDKVAGRLAELANSNDENDQEVAKELYKQASMRQKVSFEEHATRNNNTVMKDKIRGYKEKMTDEDKEKLRKTKAEVDLKKADEDVAKAYDAAVISGDEKQQKELVEQMSADRRATIMNKVQDKAAFKNTLKTLSETEQEKTNRAVADVVLKNPDTKVVQDFFAQEEAVQKEILEKMSDDRRKSFVDELSKSAGGRTQLEGIVRGGAAPTASDAAKYMASKIKKVDPTTLVDEAEIRNAVQKMTAEDAKSLSVNAFKGDKGKVLVANMTAPQIDALAGSGKITKEMIDLIKDQLGQGVNQELERYLREGSLGAIFGYYKPGTGQQTGNTQG